MIKFDCMVCGLRHGSEGCAGAVKVPKALKPKPDAPGQEPTPDALKAGYNAYMREYMRKKRAEDKAAKPMWDINTLITLIKNSEDKK